MAWNTAGDVFFEKHPLVNSWPSYHVVLWVCHHSQTKSWVGPIPEWPLSLGQPDVGNNGGDSTGHPLASEYILNTSTLVSNSYWWRCHLLKDKTWQFLIIKVPMALVARVSSAVAKDCKFQFTSIIHQHPCMRTKVTGVALVHISVFCPWSWEGTVFGAQSEVHLKTADFGLVLPF